MSWELIKPKWLRIEAKSAAAPQIS